MAADDQQYLREVQYRYPDRLAARSLLHTRYGRGDWFEWLADRIPFVDGSVVADVGCGSGGFWTNAPATVPDDLALRLFDLVSNMVRAADHEVRRLARWTDVEASVADAAALPLADGSVATALAIHMLYHLPDPGAGLRELARIAGDAGTVAVVLNPSGAMAELSALVDAALDRAPDHRAEPLTSEQALPLLRRRFTSVERFRYEDDLIVTEPSDLLAYLLSLPAAEPIGAAERLAKHVSRAFADDVSFRVTKESELLICRR